MTRPFPNPGVRASKDQAPRQTTANWAVVALFAFLMMSIHDVPCTALGQDSPDPTQRIAATDQLVDELASPVFSVRKSAYQQLQLQGYQAADILLNRLSTCQDLDQKSAVVRLLQQLPSLENALASVAPDLPPPLLLKFRDFHQHNRQHKVAVIRQFCHYPDLSSRKVVLFAIARFEPDSLIRDWAASLYLEHAFPVEASRYYAATQVPALRVIPDRQPPDQQLDATQWQMGTAELVVSPAQLYTLVHTSESNPLTQQASRLRTCLHCWESEQSFPPVEVVNQLTELAKVSQNSPIIAQSPLEFQLKSETLLRNIRWAILQTRRQASFQSQQECLTQCLHVLAEDTTVFEGNAHTFAALATDLNRIDWLDTWQQSLETQENSTPPTSILCLIEAAFRLDESDLAVSWLQQRLLLPCSRSIVVQYAVLAGELGYQQTQRHLLQTIGNQSIQGHLPSVWGHLLYSEQLAADCDTHSAAGVLKNLLVQLQADPSLYQKVNKILPHGVDGLRARYHYFQADDAASHWDWLLARQHLTVANGLNPDDTNVLKLAWDIDQIADSSAETFGTFNLLDSWHPFLPNHSAMPSADRHSDFRRQEIVDSVPWDSQDPAASFYSLTSPLGLGDTLISAANLSGATLERKIQEALDRCDQAIRAQQLIHGGEHSQSVRSNAGHKLTRELNRWAFLAASTGQQSQMAFQRAVQATQLASQEPAYFDTLSLCAQKSGRLADAIQATRMAVSLAPHHSPFQTRLANLQSVAQSDPR